ncbi:MAG: hypothetical protein DRQ51_02780 [Gammaproteobacteria bacterium]|nr:MAG: hypothetical protein DRQ51_02780 [Gammaproteobacteria bacterium]
MVIKPQDIKLDKDGYVIITNDKKKPKKEEEEINKEISDFFKGLSDKTPKLYANINEFAKTFEKRSNHWQAMIIPLIVIFTLSSIYGFFLIYSLTTSMNKMTDITTSMASKMSIISHKMKTLPPMVQNMQAINSSVSSMNENMTIMDDKMKNMMISIKKMDNSTKNIALNNNLMSQDVGRLGYNIGKPMQLFNSFMPF